MAKRRIAIDIPIMTLWEGLASAWCNPASLTALISAFCGDAWKITEIIETSPFTPSRGWGDPETFTALRKAGFRFRTRNLPPDFSDWSSLPYPILVHYWCDFPPADGDSHFACMLGVDHRGRAVLLDSDAWGVRLLKTSVLLRMMHNKKIRLLKDRGWILWLTGRRAPNGH